MHPPTGSTPQVTFPPGAGHDRYEESFNGPATYAEPYVERYGIKSEFSGREPLHPTPPRPGYVPTLGQTPPSSTQGSVMMVYGLQPDKVNTDKLFNLFCLYGNVTKVRRFSQGSQSFLIFFSSKRNSQFLSSFLPPSLPPSFSLLSFFLLRGIKVQVYLNI